MISIIVPIFNEENNIAILNGRIINVLNSTPYELIYIDDGSRDNSLNEIIKLSEINPYIKYISFSRNFGHQNALRAGYDFSSGDCIISLDGDGQHPPELIPNLIEKWKQGYQIVNTLRVDNQTSSFFKRQSSKIFYQLINFVAEIHIKDGSADFRLIDSSVKNIMTQLQENNLFIRGMISWLGYKQAYINYQVEPRLSGSSKFSFFKMFNLAIDGILGFSIRPLRLSTYIGAIVAFFAFIYGFYAIGLKIFTNISIPGWSSILLMVSLLGGLQLLMIGILGEYLGKLFIESKKRPNYIIHKSNINNE